MNKGRNIGLVFVAVIVMVGVLLWNYRNAPWLAPFLNTEAGSTQEEVAKVVYACDASKTIAATYYTDSAAPASTNTNEPPTPNGSVAVVLGDGRTMTLPQTISGSGIRYANADESLVFWSKGNTAFVTEGTGSSTATTFANCVALSNIGGQESWSAFASSTLGFSIKYPQGYTVVAPYLYQELGPGKDIKGVKFTVSGTVATGTNLGTDSGVSIEQLPKATSCSGSLFLGNQQTGSTTELTDNGVTYSVAHGNGAAAGNLYEETVYAIPGSSPCTAVRYFIHSGQIANYPPGMVTAFDHIALIKDFDGIRRSLLLAQ